MKRTKKLNYDIKQHSNYAIILFQFAGRKF